MPTQLVVNKEIYDEFLIKHAFKAEKSLWIMTGVSSDFRVQIVSKKTYRISEVLIALSKHIDLRIISGKGPEGSVLIRNLWNYDPKLVFHCPRTHSKVFIVDGKEAYIGSGNLTGAGMGRTDPTQRNWEVGIITDEYLELWKLINFYEKLWSGEYCPSCTFRGNCMRKYTV